MNRAEAKSLRSSSRSNESLRSSNGGIASSRKLRDSFSRRFQKEATSQKTTANENQFVFKSSIEAVESKDEENEPRPKANGNQETENNRRKGENNELIMHQTFRIQKPFGKSFRPLKETEIPIEPKQPSHHRMPEKTCVNFFRPHQAIHRAKSSNTTAIKLKISSKEDLTAGKQDFSAKNANSRNQIDTPVATIVSQTPSAGKQQLDFAKISARVESFRRPQTQGRPCLPRKIPEEKKDDDDKEKGAKMTPAFSNGFKIKSERNKISTANNFRYKGFGFRMNEVEKDALMMRDSIRKAQMTATPKIQLPQNNGSPVLRITTGKNTRSTGSLLQTKNNDFAIFDKFVRRNPESGLKRDLEVCYSLGKTIGKGSYAIVRMVLSKETGFKMAMKTYEKQKLYDETRRKNVRRETEILLRINHPNVIKLHEVFNCESQLHLVMEYFCTQSLHSYMKTKPGQRFDEKEAKILFKQIVEALAYCHSKYVIHRDVKLDNVLVNSQGKIKLIDFGFSISADHDQKLTLFCGTPSYMPPEIVMKKEYCGPPADTWSSGIMLYKMLSGRYPFVAKDDKGLYREICRCDLKFPDYFSREVRQLLSQILIYDPSQRIKSSSVADHIWFST